MGLEMRVIKYDSGEIRDICCGEPTVVQTRLMRLDQAPVRIRQRERNIRMYRWQCMVREFHCGTAYESTDDPLETP